MLNSSGSSSRLVERRKRPKACQARLVPACAGLHAAEFVEREGASLVARARLAEDHRQSDVHPDEQGEDRVNGQQQDHSHADDKQIEGSLDGKHAEILSNKCGIF